ncbi:MAG: hypothetical protein FD170_922 [Bacteroidetes bacterium]|nr:MAG: hypothetical protein FD170_922 [Bacteroidota bacterium]
MRCIADCTCQHLIPRHKSATGQAARWAPSPAFDEKLRYHKEKDVLTGICYSFIAKFCVLFPKPEKKNKYKKT